MLSGNHIVATGTLREQSAELDWPVGTRIVICRVHSDVTSFGPAANNERFAMGADEAQRVKNGEPFAATEDSVVTHVKNNGRWWFGTHKISVDAAGRLVYGQEHIPLPFPFRGSDPTDGSLIASGKLG